MKALYGCLLVAALGCNGVRTSADVRDAHKAKVESRLTQLARVAIVVEGSEAGAGTSVALNFEKGGNAITTQLDDISEPKDDVRPAARFSRINQDPVRLGKWTAYDLPLTNESFNPLDDRFDEAMNSLETARYVLVVRLLDHRGSYLSGDTFRPGRIKSECVLVEIDTAKVLGRFTLDTTNSDSVSSRYNSPADNIRQNLESNWSSAIAKGIQAKWPGTKTPVDWY